MPDMDAPGRVGKHLEHVIFRPWIVVFGGEDRLLVPLALPARLGFTGVVTFGGHGIARLFVDSGPIKRRRTRPQKRLWGQRVGAQMPGPPAPMGRSKTELDFEYATSVAEEAIRSMAGQRVPPTPNNFHVWFNYVLGTPPALKRAIDILIGNKRKFDAGTNREIYTSYVGSKAVDEAVAYDVSQQLHSVMASARQFLTTAIADNRTQMAAISDVSERTEA